MKSRRPAFSEKKLETLQRRTFNYFLKESNPQNGLVLDSTRLMPCSSCYGFCLAAYPVGVERGFERKDAIKRTLTTLHFFFNCCA